MTTTRRTKKRATKAAKSTVTEVTLDGVDADGHAIDQYGRVVLVTRERDANGMVVGVHRAPLVPGSNSADGWVPTDVSGFSADVQAVLAAAWTPAVVAAYQAAFPYVAPPPPSAEQLRIAAFKADPTRQNLIALIQGSTPAQINTWLTNNVTNLAQARAVLGQLILLIGGNSVS